MRAIRRKLPPDLEERMEALLKQCRNQRETRRVQVILLLSKHRWGYDEIAGATGYAPTTVRDLQTAFFRDGESALINRKKPKERRQYLKRKEEAEMLQRFEEAAAEGELVTVEAIHRAFEQRVGHGVTRGALYKLLARHGWRKVKPRPKHPQADAQRREEFKKNPGSDPSLTVKSEAFWAPPSGDVSG